MFRVSLIIPTYNEAKNIPIFLEEVFAVIDKSKIDLEFIVVDDNSPDGTGQVVEKLKSLFPVRVIHRSGKMGLGSAVIAGFASSDRPYVGVMDADLSHDPKIINELILSLQQSDIAIGSRFSEGSRVENWQWWRKIVSNVGVFFARKLTRAKDPLSGYFFLNKKIIESIPLKTKGYKILLEILVKARISKITEIPFVFRMRKFSTSKLNSQEYILFFKQILLFSFLKLYNFFKNKDNLYFALIIIFSASAIFYKISARTFWMDETAVLEYLHNTPNPFNFLREYFTYPDNHPPLYYFLVIALYKIFPWNELGIRLVSALSGLGIVILVYYFSKLFFQEKALARFAMLLTAISSYFILIVQMARYHSLAAFLMLLSLFFFCRILLGSSHKKDFARFIIFGILLCYTDLPHFFYEIAIVNIYFIYSLIKGKKLFSLKQWIAGQLILLISFLPIIYLFYLRIVGQNDMGFKNASVLGRSWVNFAADTLMHFYAYFFGENLFPWDVSFIAGVIAIIIAVSIFTISIFRKQGDKKIYLPIYLFLAAVILNVLFLNIANPRYSFIVYPKYVFVAFPLSMILLSRLVWQIENIFLKRVIIITIALVSCAGLRNFYAATSYINGSYFNDFTNYNLVKDKSAIGDYIVINGDNNIGVYNFYKKTYFNNVTPITDSELLSTSISGRFWFFATGSDGDAVYGSAGAADKIPAGFKIIDKSETVPLDPMLIALKQKLIHRQSYTYKYGVYLLIRE